MLSVVAVVMFARSGGGFRAQWGGGGGWEAGTLITEASRVVKVMTDCAEKDDCKIAYVMKDLENAPFGMYFLDCDNSSCTQRKEPTFIDSFETMPTLLAMDCPIGERCQIAKIEGTEFSLMDCRNGVCDIPVSTNVTLKGNATSMSMDCPSVGQCRIAISYLKQLRYIMCQHGMCYVSENFPQTFGRNPNISCTSDEICSLSYEGLGGEALGEEAPTFMFCSDSFCRKDGAAFGGSSTYGEISCRSDQDCKILTDASLSTKKAFINCTDKACSSGYSEQLFPFERTTTQELICSTAQDCFMFNQNSQFVHCNEDCSSKQHTQLNIDSGDRFDLACAGDSCKIAYVDVNNQAYFFACNDADCTGPEVTASSSQSSLNCPEILPPPNCTFQCSSTSGCPSCQLICGGPSSASSSEAASSESPSGPEGEASSSAQSSSRRSSRASSATSLVPACGNIGAVCGANADCCSLVCSAGNCAPPVVGGSSSAASSAPASSVQPPVVSSSRSSVAPASSAPNVQSAQSSRPSSAASSRRSSAAAANSSVQQFANCRNNGAECTAGNQCCSAICGGGVCRKTALASSAAASVRLAQQQSSARQNQQLPQSDIPDLPSPQPDSPIASGQTPITTAYTAFCGNGITDQGEECDDGNLSETDRCSSECRIATCGDRVRQGGEQCDDGNNAAGDGCSPGCVIEPKMAQGRPAARPPAAAATTSARASSVSARSTGTQVAVRPQARPQESHAAAPSVDAPVIVCGDGAREASEECDDGNVFAADGCSPSCTREACGNGRIDPNESCDRGTANGNTPDALCRPDCTLGRCGDGVRDTGEECDDGNRADGDACTSRCIVVTPSQILPASIFDAPLIPQQQPMFSGAPQATPFLASAMVAQDPAPSVPETGPGALVFMAAGGAAGYAWFRRRRGL